MSRLLDISMAINIIGLAIVAALEAWRPGFVSVAVNVSFVWIGAVVLISGRLLLNRKNNETKNTH